MANLVLTSGGTSLLRDYLAASTHTRAPQPPSWIAFGSGTHPATRFMATVPDEQFRAAISTRATSGLSVTFSAFLGKGDNIGKMMGFYGIMAGTATAGTGTGTLLAIASESTPRWKDKDSNVTVDLVLTVSGTLN